MWSYAGPANGLKDQVRFLVGDTRPGDAYLQDEEILYLLERADGDVDLAAISSCEAILAYLARSRDETVGSVSIAFSQAYKNYQAKLADLKRQLVLDGGIQPFAGGISHQAKRQTYSNADWERPDFSHDMMRSPFVAGYFTARSLVDWNRYGW